MQSAGCLTTEGSRGPSDTAGSGVAYPLTPPLNVPGAQNSTAKLFSRH